jgi:E3 ubiquitin-protein ligase MYCBP2
VLPSEEEKGTEEEETKDEDSEGKIDEEVIVTELIKKKVFPVGRAAGLRIRSEPSFAAAAIGLIKPGDVVYYSEEIENDVGKWIKLTQSSLSSFGVVKSLGYAQSYNKMKDEVFLEEGEPEEIKHVMKKHGKQDKRLGGPGTYSVVQCGAAGHNVRSKPNMKGCPIGRLAKGSTVEVVEEVCHFLQL